LIHELSGQRALALQNLRVAMRLGYSRGVIEHHPDLAELRKDPDYHRVVEVAGKARS
jgi:hypothetical protein